MKIKPLKLTLATLLCAVALSGALVHAQSGAGAWYAKGLNAFKQGQMVDAERSYLLALRKNPIHRPSYMGLLDLYIAQQRYEEGLDYADRALTHYSSDARFWLYKAKLLNQIDEVADAKQAFYKAFNAAPDNLAVVRSAEDFLYERDFETEAAQMTETRKALEADE